MRIIIIIIQYIGIATLERIGNKKEAEEEV